MQVAPKFRSTSDCMSPCGLIACRVAMLRRSVAAVRSCRELIGRTLCSGRQGALGFTRRFGVYKALWGLQGILRFSRRFDEAAAIPPVRPGDLPGLLELPCLLDLTREDL